MDVGSSSAQLPDSSNRANDRRQFARRPQLSEEIARYLREQIMLGTYREGDHLNIDGLARELETSATPVREALLTLRSEGFVKVEPRKGFRVTPLGRGDIEDISMLLRAVTGELAARATTSLTDTDLERLDALQDLMRRADESSARDELEELDLKFHRLINQSSGSAKLQWILGVLARYFPQHSHSQVPGWHKSAIEHGAILEALRKRDPESARKAASNHLKVAESILLEHLSSGDARLAPSGPVTGRRTADLELDQA
jgi:DNA-binding GntR family transcriptional regulator